MRITFPTLSVGVGSDYGSYDDYPLGHADPFAQTGSGLYVPIMKSDTVRRYTFGVVYLATNNPEKPVTDAHGDFMTADELFDTRLEYVRSGDRRLYFQHGQTRARYRIGGEWVDLVQWPIEERVTFTLPDGSAQTRTIPKDSVWMGTIWEPWVWEMVKRGEVRGLSFEGTGHRKRWIVRRR